MSADSQLLLEFAPSENLDAVVGAVGQTSLLQGSHVDHGARFEGVELSQIDRQIGDLESLVVEATLRDAADQGHLTTLEPDADRAAGPGALTLATTTGGLASAAGLTLAQTLLAVLGSRTWFKIVKSHKIRQS